MYWAKRLVAVSAIFTSVTANSEAIHLQRISYISYLIQFQREEVRALSNSDRKVNVMTSVYTLKLGFRVYPTDIGAQKIDGSIFETFRMIMANFQIENKLGKAWFFQETFLLADISAEVVLSMPYLTLSNADVQFVEKAFTWRSYTTAEALPIIKQIELINKKEFAKVVLDENSETFVTHVVSLNLAFGIHPNRAVQIVSLLTKEVKIPDKYSDFANVFSEKKVLVLPGRTELNKHAIDLENGKQLPYGLIYRLSLGELETLKTYIEIHLKTEFIRPFKSFAGAPILFDNKPDGNLHLCIDY